MDDGTQAQQLHNCNALDKNKMADNAYKKMGPAEIVKLDNQQHLNVWQKRQLESLLKEYEDLFQGKVGTRPGIKISFELKPDAKPYYAKPYSIPISLQAITKNAIQMMVSQGILQETREDTKWASPTFAVPKKTVGVQIVSDFRRLNNIIHRNPLPMSTTRE